MAVIKCKMCGGDLDLIEGQSVAECEYCGSRQTVPTADNEKKLTLFARANRLRAACEFDKAAGIYESIVADFPEEAEAYWGLVLCKYGIEYVDDPATGRKIPTCHRSSFDSIMEDGDFEQVLENADVMARKVYREEAKQIEEIRKGIIAVSVNEEPYDIFICYKETDANGDRTLDSVLAQDIYDTLTDKGYRVFFSRITLEDKLGVEYEPYIFAALNSAKIMLAIGTDYEHFNAVWVKNEWSRFLKLMATDKGKHLIPCFKGIDAYDMPREFARLQAQDLGKVGAMQDLLRGIEKILPKTKPVTVVQEKIIVQGGSSGGNGGPDTASLLKRAFMFLEDGNWQDANAYCEKVLDIDPENAQAYLGKLMAELRVKNLDRLKEQVKPFDQLNNYRKILRFGDESMIRKLNADLATIQQRIEQERKHAEIEAERNRQIKEQEESQRQQKLREEEAIRQRERQEKTEKLAKRREELKNVEGLISAHYGAVLGIKTDATVVATTQGDGSDGRLAVTAWKDISAIHTGPYHTVGLKSDGTVIATKYTGKRIIYDGKCNVTDWTDIVAVRTDYHHTAGLKANGMVVATWNSNSDYGKHGQCDIEDWTDIVAIDIGSYHTVGLKSNGTVIATKYTGNRTDNHGQCDVSGWTDIVAISAGYIHTVGLKADGTVVAVGDNADGKCDVSGWTEIVAISAGYGRTVGLKSDGTVVAVGDNQGGQCDVGGWSDIVAISACGTHTVGLRADGTVVATGVDSPNKWNLEGWKLFNSYTTIEQERIAAREITQHRKAAGLCQYCGGELKGLFSKKCSNCGKSKDY